MAEGPDSTGAEPGKRRTSILVISGPTATIQNSPPLVTGAQARLRYGLSPGKGGRFDALRPQRLAAPVRVYIEAFSAHPLEADAGSLYGKPDGYVDEHGQFRSDQASRTDLPVYVAELRPEDGLYLLPYMARQADGGAWEQASKQGANEDMSDTRQTFYPDASRIFEEIDRFGLDAGGHNNLLSRAADYTFVRAAPSAGYMNPANQDWSDSTCRRSSSEEHGKDFFAYSPKRLAQSPALTTLASLTNTIQDAIEKGNYAGAIWLEGSGHIEETIYWLNLLIDTTLPLCGNASQRPHGVLSNDGDRNILSSVLYIRSRVWADGDGRDCIGAVLVQDEQIFAAREVHKADARPGGFRASGGHGGLIGAVGTADQPKITFKPTKQHTSKSEVNLRRLPHTVSGVVQTDSGIATCDVQVKDPAGGLLAAAMPMVTVVKHVRFGLEDCADDPEQEVEIFARIARNLARFPLAGFVLEGSPPYGDTDESKAAALERAVFSGMPVVCVGRGNVAGMVPARHQEDVFLTGSNLTATKARLLLMACLLRFGSPAPAADPMRPTLEERAMTLRHLANYQRIFDTH